METQEVYLKPSEVCKLLGISNSTLTRMRMEAHKDKFKLKLPYIKIGEVTRYPKSKVLEALNNSLMDSEGNQCQN
ncbi:helix-turn-helix domain-containing protein [Campylobacter sp.]|uniref:helix-turn-helix domain-containing protein n=1 Tax=Campylobacter sp. TaxID=205 RepID=UPI00403E86B7